MKAIATTFGETPVEPTEATHRSRFAVRRAAGLCLAIAAAGASAQATTVGVGQTLGVTTATDFPSIAPLVMDGGTLRIGDSFAGRAIVVNATDAVLGRGYINHWYAQQGGTVLNFFGTTTVPGAPTGPFPADGMYFRASPFDTTGLNVVNKGTFVQSGTGQLSLIGPVRFVGDPLSNYFIDNDRGIEALSTDAQFVNNGSSVIKRAGTGTSRIDVPIVHNAGKYEVWTGNLVLGAGGTYQNGTFYADGLGTNPSGFITFGGTHVFRGFTTTETGNFLIAPGSTVRATITTPTDIGQWNQRATLLVQGTLDVAGSVVVNSGSLTTIGAGAITGSSNGTLFNQAGATFAGNIRESTGPGGPDWLNVTNYGQFTVDVGQTAEVGRFVNHDGVLRVDGTLTNLGTRELHLYGGVLQGSGIINSDVFVGGGPGVARFRPGNSPGTMTIDGGFTLEANGVLELEVESTPGGIAWDRLLVSGPIALNGRVELHVGDGVTLADLQGLQFFACSEAVASCSIDIAYGGNFDWAFPNRPGSSAVFSSSGLEITSLAPIVAVPEPQTYALILAGLGLVGCAARRARRSRVA